MNESFNELAAKGGCALKGSLAAVNWLMKWPRRDPLDNRESKKCAVRTMHIYVGQLLAANELPAD